MTDKFERIELYKQFINISEEEIEKILNALDPDYNEPEVDCECGSEKIYGKSCLHSNWCPKYKK